jgi:heptosyltransferase-2
VLQNNPLIDELLTYGFETYIITSAQCYDEVICLDKDPRATALAYKLFMDDTNGFSMDFYTGTCRPASSEGNYLFRLGIDDDLKFKLNEKNYMECVFEACDLEWAGEEYLFNLTEAELKRIPAKSGMVIGLNTGCGKNWQKRKWGADNWIDLCNQIVKTYPGVELLLLGGEAEKAMNYYIEANTLGRAQAIRAMPVREFAGIVKRCDAIVTGDTAAMHIAIAVGTPPVVLLGPTHTPEIYLYERGVKVVSDFDCVPCFDNECDKSPGCVESIPVSRVMDALAEVLK